MASYDSDSSEGEFEETNVLLGYASKDADEDTISHLGGLPEWLEPEKPPTAALARCKVCKDMMVLLLQLNGELPEKFPGHDRRLYVFGCRRPTCRRQEGSIRAMRGVRVWKEVDEKAPKPEKKEEEKEETPKLEDKGPGLGETLFGATSFGGGSANPFASGGANLFKASSSTPAANPFGLPSQAPPQPAKPIATEKTAAQLFKTFAETLSINAPPTQPPPPPEPWPETKAQPAAYPTLYLADADYETLDNTAASIPQATQIIDSEDASEPSVADREAFESTMDFAFQKFADRLAQNPDQCIRYEFGGTPLLYSKTDAVGEKLSRGGIPGCGNCGGRRMFEVQMTPNAIMELEAGEDLSADGMEWGTIIVGVCAKDCVPRTIKVGKAGYLEEWAGVQWEELINRK